MSRGPRQRVMTAGGKPSWEERASAAIAALNRCTEAIGRRLDPLTGEADRLREMHLWAISEVNDLLATERVRPGTPSQVAEFRRLDQELTAHGYGAGERMQLICQRMDIRRTRYYELRDLAKKSAQKTGFLRA
jgi:hypothetical protein